MPHDRDRLMRSDCKPDIFENPILVLVGKPDISEFHTSGDVGPFRWHVRAFRGSDGNRRVEQPEDALRTRHRTLENVVLIAEVLDRLKEAAAVLNKSRKNAQGQICRENLVAA